MTRSLQPRDLIRPEIIADTVYHVPDATGLVKLDAMENPHVLPEALRGQWVEYLACQPVNRYPDPGARELKQQLRASFGIGSGYDILLGNGSDEIIQSLVLALARPQARALAFEPSFVMYARCARLCGMDYTGVPLRDDFSIPLEQTLRAITECRPALVFVAQPNNPTGNLCAEETLLQIAAATPGLLVIDEAYHAFSGVDSLAWLETMENLLVMRTLSKLGLAGLRIGFLVGRREWIAELEKVRMPYNIGTLAQAGAVFFLQHREQLHDQAARIRQDREQLRQALGQFAEVQQWPSAANFILFRVRNLPARVVHAGLINRGILIKCLDGVHPLLRDCLRVTVGTAAENAAFLAALAQVLGNTHA
jgi:histidinol-phosphate aminotransferase